MIKLRKTLVLAAALLLGATACADLEVENPNDPDRTKALATAGDVESLISGTYSTWYDASHDYNMLFLSTASFQHSAPWNNFGMVPLSAIPRNPLVNNPSDQFYGGLATSWTTSYRVLAAAADGLRSLDDAKIAGQLGADRVLRARAFAKFTQGLALGNLALLYDKAFVVDEKTDVNQKQEAKPYTEVMQAALAKLDEAAQLSRNASFTVPKEWMSVAVTGPQLARIASSFKAAYRSSVARTPEERAAVNWQQVLADVNAGVQSTFTLEADPDNWYNSFLDYGTYPTWQQVNYTILGMADQSGNYQTWLNTPVSDRRPQLGGKDILIITPDQRFPQGRTVAEQTANPGSMYIIPTRSNEASINVGSQWARPDRGTWRWSYYWGKTYAYYNYAEDFTVPEIKMEEMNLLAAEAHLRTGNRARAAELINLTRTKAGLNATNAAGLNTSCVPRLPNGQCGDLMEMLKWEKRLETWMVGTMMGLSWYFDGRGWGDLYKGTYLQFPIPCREAQVLQMLPCYSFGGVGGQGASKGSIYAFPNE